MVEIDSRLLMMMMMMTVTVETGLRATSHSGPAEISLFGCDIIE